MYMSIGLSGSFLSKNSNCAIITDADTGSTYSDTRVVSAARAATTPVRYLAMQAHDTVFQQTRVNIVGAFARMLACGGVSVLRTPDVCSARRTDRSITYGMGTEACVGVDGRPLS